MASSIISAAGGLAVGILLTALVLLGRLSRERRAVAALRTALSEAGIAQGRLAELRANLSGLRHDIRGILSPALLVADRLISHEDAGIRRAGEVMVRTVDRATARLGETRIDQEAESAQP